MKIGLLVIAISVVWYIVHAVIYNYYLQKNNPGLFDEIPSKSSSQKRDEVNFVVTSGKTPSWVALMGMPPIPLFLIGILITVIGFIISLFK
jgi:uncharacterized membrane protein